MPENTSIERTRWADQGWSPEVRERFHHLPQGTATLPMSEAWFRALEQPSFWPGEQPRIADPDYLRRFGFIVEADDPLPVGFAVDAHYEDPTTGREYRAVGLTCAACHTGQLEYRGVSYRIDGAPAMIALDRFYAVLALSVLETTYMPGRFERAANRILGTDHSDADEQALERQLDRMRALLFDHLQLRWRARRTTVTEGFARLDALHRMTNQVFVTQLNAPGNFHGYDAPVSYPPLWDTPWLNRQMYDASAQKPLVRGAMESLGAGAGINLTAMERDLFTSKLRVHELREVRQWLEGYQPPVQAGGFTGLLAPEWPEKLLGSIDRGRAAKGEQLYDRLCMKCHGPPPHREDFFDDSWWTAPDDQNRSYWKVHVTPLSEIGTDPARARSAVEDRVKVPDTLGLPDEQDTLAQRLEQVASLALARLPEPREDAAPDRPSPDGSHASEAKPALGYRARPLDGVWATAPYLHNGSVPTLYALLSPPDERPTKFAVGSRRFDPQKVGYETDTDHGSIVDTRIDGNRNTGHAFDEGKGPGVLGPRLSEAERYQLIEYLKTITSRRLSVAHWEPIPLPAD